MVRFVTLKYYLAKKDKLSGTPYYQGKRILYVFPRRNTSEDTQRRIACYGTSITNPVVQLTDLIELGDY